VVTATTVLSVLITILNLSSTDDMDIINGMEFLGFFTAMENIIANDDLALVAKSVSLLAISNLYTHISKVSPDFRVSGSTINFALFILNEWP
jgi:hypothetical protein